MVDREVIGAHYGTRDWLAQRVTAVIMVMYTVFIVGTIVSLPRMDYPQWAALWSLPIVRYATLFFVISVLYHAWVGIRNVLMDYVQHLPTRLVLHVAVILSLIAYGMWSVQIIWRI